MKVDLARAAIILLGAASAVGCASLQAASSGQIGCAEDEIVVTNDEGGWGTRTWTAECRGKRFFCSAVQTGKNDSQVNCKEEAASAAAPDSAQTPPPKAAVGGCEYDTQCKGDRVCVNGRCAAPESNATKSANQADTPVGEPPAQ